MKQDIVSGFFHRLLSAVDKILWSTDTIFNRQICYLINMRCSTITKCDHLNFFVKGENASMIFC